MLFKLKKLDSFACEKIKVVITTDHGTVDRKSVV